MTSTSPRTRCRVQRGNHPALRYGVQKSASCGYCLCRYLWIPHQVRNDGTAGSSKGVTPHSDAGSREGRRGIYLPVFLDTASCTGSPRTAMRGPVCESPRTTMRGPEKCLLRVLPLPVFPGYRVAARYDVEHRIKCGMTWSTVWPRRRYPAVQKKRYPLTTI